jgi:arsenate reductase
MKKKVLFVCIHNSARSVMAEAFINQLCGAQFEAQSAGIEPGKLNPIVAQAMLEIDVDVSGHQPRSVAAVLRSGQEFDTVITVCDETSAERCPIFPGGGERLHWGFPDPSALQGTSEGKLAGTREIRDTSKTHIEHEFCAYRCVAAA